MSTLRFADALGRKSKIGVVIVIFGTNTRCRMASGSDLLLS
ncbi:protein of unknown function [Pararobbsia alpina]